MGAWLGAPAAGLLTAAGAAGAPRVPGAGGPPALGAAAGAAPPAQAASNGRTAAISATHHAPPRAGRPYRGIAGLRLGPDAVRAATCGRAALLTTHSLPRAVPASPGAA